MNLFDQRVPNFFRLSLLYYSHEKISPIVHAMADMHDAYTNTHTPQSEREREATE